EDVTDEGRLVRDVDADYGRLLLLFRSALLVQLPFRVARTPHEVVDHLLRQARHRAFPIFRQEIDIKAFTGTNCIQLDLGRRRGAHRAAVRITACGIDIVRGVAVEPPNRDRDWFVEADNHDPPGAPRGRFNRLIKLEYQPHISAIRESLDPTFDGV